MIRFLFPEWNRGCGTPDNLPTMRSISAVTCRFPRPATYDSWDECQILIAEDNLLQADVLERYLLAEGHETFLVHDGPAALTQARERRPDMVVLDVMLPGLDGLAVCRELRQESSVLILMLTARAAENDMLQGLDLGADDYLTKPYSPRELVTRVRTLLRRVDRVRTKDSVLYVGGLTVDRAARTAGVDGRSVECTPAELAILIALAERPGRVLSRAQLLERVAEEKDSTSRAIDTHVLNLRRKIEADPRRPTRLLAVYGLGYKLI